jgi:nucleoside-diphosphate-sugar epimerase
MLTDGQEEREFLYAEDCCEALEAIVNNYNDFTSEDNLHITSFHSTKIIDIASIIKGQFNLIGKYDVAIVPSEQKDSVQMDKRNHPNAFITKWWLPKTTIDKGIEKIFKDMEKDYASL